MINPTKFHQIWTNVGHYREHKNDFFGSVTFWPLVTMKTKSHGPKSDHLIQPSQVVSALCYMKFGSVVLAESCTQGLWWLERWTDRQLQYYPMTNAIFGWRKGVEAGVDLQQAQEGNPWEIPWSNPKGFHLYNQIRLWDWSKNLPGPVAVFTLPAALWRPAPVPVLWSLCGSPMGIGSYYNIHVSESEFGSFASG